MDGKREILDALRPKLPPSRPLPSLDGPWVTYDDPRQQFCEAIQAVGGRVAMLETIDQLPQQLQQIPAWNEAQQTGSMIEGVGANVSIEALDDPHELADLDFAVLRGEFAVAENGAVWVSEQGLRHRVAYFIAQHLALVVPSDQIVHNMHQAYDRLHFDTAGFGAFISGPSKTADIEQSLVIGAHGPRSLTVLLVEPKV